MNAHRIETSGRAGKAQSERDADLRLIARVGDGDAAAFDELYRKYRPRLTRFLANMVRQPQIVEEVLDDTLMVVWQRAGDFKGESKLSTWIFAIAYRKAMKALRRYDAPVEDHEAENRASHDAGPEEAFGQVRLNRLLRAAMAELSHDAPDIAGASALLVRGGAWRLTLSTDPAEAIALLAALLPRLRETACGGGHRD